MFKSFKSYIITFLLFILSVPLFSVESKLEYITYPQPPERTPPFGEEKLKFSKTPAIPNLKLPKLHSKFPLYSTFKFCHRDIPVIIDSKSENDSFYNVVYIDLNTNNDLSDDTMLSAETFWNESSKKWQAFVMSPDLKWKIDGKEIQYGMRVKMYLPCEKKDPPQTEDKVLSMDVFVRANSLYKTTFEIDGKKYKSYLVDHNLNNNFTEILSVENFDQKPDGYMGLIKESGDIITFIEEGKEDSYCPYEYSEYLVIKDKLFKIKADMTAGSFSLNPINENIGWIEFPGYEMQNIQLINADYSNAVMIFQPGSKVPVPAGKYKIFSYSSKKTTDSDGVWQINGNGTYYTPEFLVESGKTHNMEFGEPFTAKIYTSFDKPISDDKENNFTSIFFGITGKAKETITELRLAAGNSSSCSFSKNYTQRPIEPKFKIIKSDGSIVKDGSFEYG